VERGTYGGIAGNGGEKPGVVAVELGAAGGREVRHRRDEVGEHEHLQDERNHGPDEREYHAAHRPDTSQRTTDHDTTQEASDKMHTFSSSSSSSSLMLLLFRLLLHGIAVLGTSARCGLLLHV